MHKMSHLVEIICSPSCLSLRNNTILPQSVTKLRRQLSSANHRTSVCRRNRVKSSLSFPKSCWKDDLEVNLILWNWQFKKNKSKRITQKSPKAFCHQMLALDRTFYAKKPSDICLTVLLSVNYHGVLPQPLSKKSNYLLIWSSCLGA